MNEIYILDYLNNNNNNTVPCNRLQNKEEEN